jgi:hypothetical protein
VYHLNTDISCHYLYLHNSGSWFLYLVYVSYLTCFCSNMSTIIF